MDPLQAMPVAIERPELDADDDLAWLPPEGKGAPVVHVLGGGQQPERPFPSAQWSRTSPTPLPATPAFSSPAIQQPLAVDATPAWMESTLARLIRALDNIGGPKEQPQPKKPAHQLGAKVYSPFLGER